MSEITKSKAIKTKKFNWKTAGIIAAAILLVGVLAFFIYPKPAHAGGGGPEVAELNKYPSSHVLVTQSRHSSTYRNWYGGYYTTTTTQVGYKSAEYDVSLFDRADPTTTFYNVYFPGYGTSTVYIKECPSYSNWKLCADLPGLNRYNWPVKSCNYDGRICTIPTK